MGKFDGMLIVSDLDGTFLGKGARIVPENLEAIKRFTSEGGLFTFATGRSPHAITSTLGEAFELANAPAILVNGSVFYDYNKRRLFDEEFSDAGVLREIISYAKANYPEIEFRIASGEGQFTDSIDGPKLSKENALFGGYTVYPFEEIPECGWYKCVFCGEVDTLAKIREALEPKYSSEHVFFESEAGLLEIQRKGTSKASKMLMLKQKYADEGRPVTVYACGDYENDYEMLKAADVAVCPTNALESIRAIADISPCDNDEGLIAALIDIIESKL